MSYVCNCFISRTSSSSSHSSHFFTFFQVPLAAASNPFLICAVTFSEARSWTKTQTQRARNHRPLHGICILPLHHPQCHCISARCIRPTVHCVHFHLVRWCGCILFMGRAMWGTCHMAEVIRWSTGENMKNNTVGDTRLSLLLPCTALFTSNVHVGVQNSFDLSWNGRPRIGQHNRSCFEMLDLLEKCRTIEMAGF